ncbi:MULTISPECIES: hypothetical protein [unclassified Archaeoglobus]|mgnify:CR=1 FL=1|jgi:uncharacterized DUF497 family protein|uniref:hypothetical protein n=1 Tax=unclassified Archaeoglobus TaxID=2643606 RepID=UPI0025B82FF1|nr:MULTISPECIES: hypothetical protein [unclassified Archaeoglobus]
MGRRKPRIYRVKVEELEIWYTDRIINHIAKHNVRIDEVITALAEGKKIYLRLKKGKDWVAIVKHPYSGRYLTVFLEKTGKHEFRLKTARDSTKVERRLFKRRYS